MKKIIKKVDLPDRQIARKKNKNGTTYIYYRMNFRRENGEPTFDEIGIGKLDESGKKLIPNRNYYDLFPDDSNRYVISNKSFGLTYVLNKIVKDLRLDKTLLSIFGNDTYEILTLAFYILANGNVVSHTPSWIDDSVLPYEISELTSQKISRLFERIDYEKRLNFFKKWTKRHLAQECWYYDVTSISSYSKKISILEFGYNRDMDKLPQINIGMCYGSTTKLPLFYQVYNGSITDKTYFSFLLRDFPFISLNNRINLVTDQGFVTQDNLAEVANEEGQKFGLLCPLPLYWNDAKRILENHTALIKQDANYIKGTSTFGCSVIDTVMGQPVKIYVYYNMGKAPYEIVQFYEKISRMEEELEELKKLKYSLLDRKKYRKYFDIKINEDGFTYEKKSEAIDEYLRNCGFLILISIDCDLTPSEALFRYRQKDVIEKQFFQLKNEIDFRRLKTHNLQTTEGKLFVGFLALILRSYILNLLKNDTRQKKFNIPDVIKELQKIKVIETKNGSKLMVPLTKKQKDILKIFNIEEDDFLKSIFKKK